MAKRILFVAPYPPGCAANQRFRYEHYLTALGENGWDVAQAPFWSEAAWRMLYRRGQMLRKAAALVSGYLRRLWLLLTGVRRFDVVFVHREATPLGPPWFEWCVSRMKNVRLVYDFDDAIWIEHVSGANPLAGRMRSYDNVARVCALATRVSCGSAFLADYARRTANDVVVNPTVVDTDAHHNRVKRHGAGRPVVGWTGTHSTLSHLETIAGALTRLAGDVAFDVQVIADAEPAFELPNMTFVRWNRDTEIEDLMAFDVGLMPLPDTDWARGKCGFKLIQYMSLGIPAAASPVGVNRDIVSSGENGFLCTTEEDWVRALEMMLRDPEARSRMGRSARATIVERYSVAANGEAFLETVRFAGLA